MATVHVYVDYKRDRRRIRQLCIASMMIILFVPINVMFQFQRYRGHTTEVWVEFCSLRALQHSVYVISSLSYSVLLHNLCKRYELLNLLLKHRFLSETTSNFQECKSNTIKFIKFIGQQHCRLNDIMELVNFCYAFQVKTISNV